jgi:hypothetical protein
MICADYSGHCQAHGEVPCSVCGQQFCWDHILTLRFAHKEAIVQERSVCRSCTEHLFDELEEDRLQCRRDVHALEHDVAALKKQLEEEPETASG